MRKTVVLLKVLGLGMAFLMAASSKARAQGDTSGKLTLESKSVALGVGVSWGDGGAAPCSPPSWARPSSSVVTSS